MATVRDAMELLSLDLETVWSRPMPLSAQQQLTVDSISACCSLRPPLPEGDDDDEIRPSPSKQNVQLVRDDSAFVDRAVLDSSTDFYQWLSALNQIQKQQRQKVYEGTSAALRQHWDTVQAMIVLVDDTSAHLHTISSASRAVVAVIDRMEEARHKLLKELQELEKYAQFVSSNQSRYNKVDLPPIHDPGHMTDIQTFTYQQLNHAVDAVTSAMPQLKDLARTLGFEMGHEEAPATPATAMVAAGSNGHASL